jgi:hypothetical protein
VGAGVSEAAAVDNGASVVIAVVGEGGGEIAGPSVVGAVVPVLVGKKALLTGNLCCDA